MLTQYRTGVKGLDRIKAHNYYFKEMLGMIVPESQKYLIYAASRGVDIFDPVFNAKVNYGTIKLEDLPADERWRHEAALIMGTDQAKHTCFS